MKKMKSNAPRASIFDSVQVTNVPQSRFNLSYDNKFTCNMGEIIPFMCKPIVPGDKFNCQVGAFLRLQPLVAPIMHNIDVEFRYFYVPNRILWTGFDDYIRSVDYQQHPVFEHDSKLSNNSKRLLDMLGLTVPVNNTMDANQKHKPYLNPFPILAYNSIWNYYFRDENLQAELLDKIDNANDMLVDDLAIYVKLKKVDWRKDYFTSSLPFTQKGQSAKAINEIKLRDDLIYGTDEQLIKSWKQPVDESNPVLVNGFGSASTEKAPFLRTPKDSGTGAGADGRLGIWSSADLNITPRSAFFDPNGTLIATMDINALREANAIQRFLERSAIGGNRISEFYLGHFNVRVSDSRLQMPEYLGGGKFPIVISEIPQTSQTTESSPQGTLAGKGVATGALGFKKPYFFKEYGWLVGLMYIRPSASYFQGIEKYLYVNEKDRFDLYYFPEFANLGEQPVYEHELYFGTRESVNDTVFGYQSPYANLKYNKDEIHGDFQTSLTDWHLARIFDGPPTLNDGFVSCNPREDFFAVPNQMGFLVDVYNKIDAVRPMPMFGTPKL